MADSNPATEPTAENEKTTKINLHNPITVNGVTYPSGQGVEVPKRQAEDLSRMDYEHEQYKANLHTKRTFEEKGPTIAVGGGS